MMFASSANFMSTSFSKHKTIICHLSDNLSIIFMTFFDENPDKVFVNAQFLVSRICFLTSSNILACSYDWFIIKVNTPVIDTCSYSFSVRTRNVDPFSFIYFFSQLSIHIPIRINLDGIIRLSLQFLRHTLHQYPHTVFIGFKGVESDFFDEWFEIKVIFETISTANMSQDPFFGQMLDASVSSSCL